MLYVTQNTSRRAMIDAAEQLIAEHGLSALTLKAVQNAAGQLNKSAAKYHFGSREGLLDVIIETRMSRVNELRRVRLDQLGSAATVRATVAALVEPLAAETLGRVGSRYARFLSQAVSDPALAEILQKHLSAGSFRRVQDILSDFVDAPREVAEWRVAGVVNLTLVTFASWEAIERSPERTAAIVCDLVDTCVAVLQAPVTAILNPKGNQP